jgi:signal transduction histidine kinase
MTQARPTMPRPWHSLSARLLALTAAFVMLAEVLIFLPSAARFRVGYFESRLAAAHIATRALLAAPDAMVSPELEAELLRNVGAFSVAWSSPEKRVLMLGHAAPGPVAATYDLRTSMAAQLAADAVLALIDRGPRLIRVIGAAPQEPRTTIELVLDQAPLGDELREFSLRILGLSVAISLITAGLVFLSLRWLMVRPLRRLTASMMAFRANPEDATRVIKASGRRDEFGLAERELADMQSQLRAALTQKTRLAALGAAVSKISHDLRNVLSTAQLVSDRLAESPDPGVRPAANRLVASIDRAIALCSRTLQFGRADEPPPRLGRFPLAPLLDEVAQAAGRPGDAGVRWRTEGVGDLVVDADREQLFRVLLNLARNAHQAMADGGEIRVAASRQDHRIVIDFADTGGGIAPAARDRLFQPFLAGRTGGTGLGLAIAKELARAHGGDLGLVTTGAGGTTFRLTLPAT